jgi:dTDP-4-amino-4,6-dideoxygalactose transaminase
MVKMVDLFYPYVPPEAIEEVNETLLTKWIGQAGKVDLFEERFGEIFNLKYCISLNSGTSALETAYELLDLKEGDEVISTPLTCTATNIPLLHRGVKIVWADILPDTLCIDPLDVRRKLNEEKTKAVVQVHLGGIGANVGTLPVPVVSDACQALGIFTGTFTCNSFQAIKHITTGDGGMLICPNEDYYRKAKLLRWFGVDRNKKLEGDDVYERRLMSIEPELVGHKRQMNDIQASLGLGGLKQYRFICEYRKMLFDLYKQNLPGIKIVDGEINTYWAITILIDRRNDLARKLKENGVETNVLHARNDSYGIFGGKADLPVLNELEFRYLSLPLHMNLKEGDIHYICSCIKKGW